MLSVHDYIRRTNVNAMFSHNFYYKDAHVPLKCANYKINLHVVVILLALKLLPEYLGPSLRVDPLLLGDAAKIQLDQPGEEVHDVVAVVLLRGYRVAMEGEVG